MPGDLLHVRFSSSNEAELCVEDLRASGDPELTRLAEADRVQSTSMSTRGDDDGWLTEDEVRGARGLHYSLAEGFVELRREAEKRGAPTLPLADARVLVRRSSGPLKKKPAPDNPVRPVNPIRAAAPSTMAPDLLAHQEARVDAEISSDPDMEPVYRGFSLHDYSGADMVRYLFGDWRCVVASHTFTKDLKQRLADGIELNEAVRQTGTAIADRIVGEIRKNGVAEYMTAQSRATQIGIRDKKATAMASYPDSPLPSGMTPTSFSYARSGYLGLIHDTVLEPSHPMIMVEVDQRVRRDLGLTEHYIPSHVPPTRVRRFFVGFSTWYDTHLYERPKEQKETWYEVTVLGRDAHGRPTGFEIKPAHPTVAGTTESWEIEPHGWRSDGGPLADHDFVTKHPLLASTIAEMRAQL